MRWRNVRYTAEAGVSAARKRAPESADKHGTAHDTLGGHFVDDN